ncbi:hypothetical protein [Shimia haliotis]|uniref:Uncharacterized protein n=1 Tax=Shimia haliotis TaxID=1280847 RepID=A0A1I4HHG0_9RHOB|nr:hypothetical protein [Shimia haliotis]SFL41622.1 hypothetical protein SAMN04488036_11348 [Shimia haliotis]
MILFLLSNIAFLASFVWLMLGATSLTVWGIWIFAWVAADYAVMWLTGYEPPAWMWGATITALGVIWVVLNSTELGL